MVPEDQAASSSSSSSSEPAAQASKETASEQVSSEPAAQASTETASEQVSSEAAAPPSTISEVTDPHHAVSLIRGRVSQLHQLVNNIGNVASVPVHAIEDLIAEIKYLMGVIR